MADMSASPITFSSGLPSKHYCAAQQHSGLPTDPMVYFSPCETMSTVYQPPATLVRSPLTAALHLSPRGAGFETGDGVGVR